MDFKGTKSEENIKSAFAGESQARNRYTYFAAQARAEGNKEIAELFDKMAENEMTHAKIWFKLMNNGLGNSVENLQAAANGENYEWQEMYPDFAEQAREDGFEELAVMFERVAAIESDHERRFLEAYIKLQKEQGHKLDTTNLQEVSKTKPEITYRCMFCGAVSENRLDVCPVCEAIGAFELVRE